MTKKRTRPSSKTESTKSKPSYYHKILARVKEAGKKPITQIAAVIALFTAFGLLDCYFSVAGLSSHAVLYLLANNGKMSGRMGGNVMMRNGRSRGFTMPSLVQNDATSTVRTNFGSLSAAWNTLTDGQRKSWNVIGGYFRTDRFGNSVALNGKALFVALNRGLFSVGQPQINTAPTVRSVIGPSTLSVAIDDSATSMILTFTATPIPADTSWEVFATAPQSPGTFDPSESKYRLITVLPAATATGADVYTEYADKFGAPPIGTKVFIKIKAVSTVTGQQSAGHVAFSIVVA